MMNLNIKEFDPPIEQRVDNLTKLSKLVNSFIDVKRSTSRNNRDETDGEHTLHLQFLAVTYAAEYHPELDIGKVSLYALVHDFIEVFSGDVNSLKATAEDISRKALTEKVAFDRLVRELGDTWAWFVNLIRDYEELSDSEARYVKCFDKCDPSFSHIADKGQALIQMEVYTSGELIDLSAGVKERMATYSDEFPDVMAIREELLDRVVKEVYSPV